MFKMKLCAEMLTQKRRDAIIHAPILAAVDLYMLEQVGLVIFHTFLTVNKPLEKTKSIN